MRSRGLSKIVTGNGNDGNDLFDRKPVTVGGFRFRARRVVPVGRPSIAQYAAALEFACATHQDSPYWIGDLVSYGESRDDWREKLSQAMSVTGLAEQTLHNYAYVSRRMDTEARSLAPTAAHAAEVVTLEPPDRVAWLDKARTEGWTTRELRMEIQASKRRKVIEGHASLEGMFRVWYADPPWSYNDHGDIKVGNASAYKRAVAHYPTMTIEDLCLMPVEPHTTPAAVLFLWVTSPMLLQHPGPREVIEAWGFEYKASMVWDKVLGNFGHYTHVNHEFLLICTRGSCLPDRPTPQPDSVFTERRSNVHSEKPDSVRTMIEKLYDGPYVELFGRKRVEGWTVYGNQLRPQAIR